MRTIPLLIVLAFVAAGFVAPAATAGCGHVNDPVCPGTEVGEALSPNPWLDRAPLNIAHQGGEVEAPSNTLYAFKTALAKGADVLELDVHATSDGEIVVLHDATVDRTTDGAGRVDALTLDEIKQLDAAHWFVPDCGTCHGQPEASYEFRGIATGDTPAPAGFTANDFRIPTLREVLETFRFPNGQPVLLNIEIKNGAPDTTQYEAEVAQLLHEFGRTDDVIVVSFNDAYTETFKVHAPYVSTATGTGETAAFWASSQAVLPGAPSHHHALQVPVTYEGLPVVTQDFVDDAHANGLAVHVWTINDRETMETLLDLGVDGIMTDRPTLLEEVLADRGMA